jgi:hypothetical protein
MANTSCRVFAFTFASLFLKLGQSAPPPPLEKCFMLIQNYFSKLHISDVNATVVLVGSKKRTTKSSDDLELIMKIVSSPKNY